jgi:hypothetical protein
MFRERLRRWRSALSARLVDDWRNAWKWASVRLAALSGILTAILTAAPGFARELWDQLPAELRAAAPAWVPLLVTAIPIAVRLYRQGGRDA